MKEEFKKYLESETKKNDQEVYMRETLFKIRIFLIIIGLGLCALGIFKAIF